LDSLDSDIADILNASDDEILAQAAAEFGSPTVLAEEFDRIMLHGKAGMIAAPPVVPADEVRMGLKGCALFMLRQLRRASDAFVFNLTYVLMSGAFVCLLAIAIVALYRMPEGDFQTTSSDVVQAAPPAPPQAFLPTLPRPDTPATAGNLGFLRKDAMIVRKVRLAPNDGEYYAKFSLRASSSVSIDLSEDGRQSGFDVKLFREESGQRSPQQASVPNATGQGISADLDAGTYFVRVKRSSGLPSATQFELSLRSQAHLASVAPLVGAQTPDGRWLVLDLRSKEAYRAGDYAKAATFAEEALNHARKASGDRSPQTLTSLDTLALFYMALGRFSEAEPLDREALQGWRKVRGPHDPRTLFSLNNLAALYHSQGRFSEAEPLFQEALQAMREVYGPHDPQTLTALNNLAAVYQSQGRYGEAEPLYREALEAMRALLGARDPQTLTSLNNLAAVYQSQGRYGEAEPLYREALQARREVLGARHPDTLVSLNALAELYQSQGRNGEAERLLRQALPASRDALGPHAAQPE
jgi:tetratricopeptide (TPR) repeat protein